MLVVTSLALRNALHLKKVSNAGRNNGRMAREREREREWNGTLSAIAAQHDHLWNCHLQILNECDCECLNCLDAHWTKANRYLHVSSISRPKQRDKIAIYQLLRLQRYSVGMQVFQMQYEIGTIIMKMSFLWQLRRFTNAFTSNVERITVAQMKSQMHR